MKKKKKKKKNKKKKKKKKRFDVKSCKYDYKLLNRNQTNLNTYK